MSEHLQEQARLLYETIRLMKRRFPQPETLMRDNRDSSGAEYPDLTIPQLNMLSTCHDIGPATIKEIAEVLEVSAPSASAMVDRLVEMRVLTREQSPRDRRQVVVRLTDVGARVVLRMEEYMVDAFSEVLERIGPHYADMWCEVYREITRVYGEVASSRPELREGVAS